MAAKRGRPTVKKPAKVQIFVSIPPCKKQELQDLADQKYSSLSQVAMEFILQGLEAHQQAS